jgi:hypothetical protein
MRKHHLAGISAGSVGLGVLLGVVVAGGHREAGGVEQPHNTMYVKLVDHCGHLIRTDRGIPVEIQVPLVPPVSEGVSQRTGQSLPDMGDGGARPVVARPPIVAEYRKPAIC